MQPKVFKKEWAGRSLEVEVGHFANQANGSCTVRYGDTVVLACATMSSQTRDIDFFPLSVELEERMYAAGKIKGSRFIKREGRPSDEAVLSGRLIDRSIRPLFDDRMRNEIQVVVTTLSYDGENDPEVVGLLAASIALTISDIPWAGPIAGVRVGLNTDGSFITNPTVAQVDAGGFDLYVAGTGDRTIMIEAGTNEIPEDTILSAIRHAQKSLGEAVDFVAKIQKEIGKEKVKVETELAPEIQRAVDKARAVVKEKMQEYFFDEPKASKVDRRVALGKVKDDLMSVSEGLDEAAVKKAASMIYGLVEEQLVERILEKGERVDGRSLTDIRDLVCEVGLLPRTHGSAHFSRGETQVVSVVTLGAPGDVQTLDTMELDEKKRYMHHYNFPPYSVGEVKPMRGPGRREIGHGALAEKALVPVLPPEADFPYAIRVVSEVFGSNGSSSMASTCGSTLALMDAGVPIKKHVAGIAMGLASNHDMSKWKVLTDLQDLEDGEGGMDFKITGTKDGITAIQLDTKTAGLTDDIVVQTLKQSKEARMRVISKMEEVMPAPRAEMSPWAPRIVTIVIDPEKIREVIGPGGKVINKIIDETGVQIDIEQDGRVMITSNNAEGMKAAIEQVQRIVKEVEPGEIYEGKVVRLEDFGAFVNVLPGKDGLVHVSEVSWSRVGRPGDVLNIGDTVKVKVKEIDNLGRINLTIKDLLPKPEGWTPPPPRPPRDRDDRGGRGGRGGFGGRGRG